MNPSQTGAEAPVLVDRRTNLEVRLDFCPIADEVVRSIIDFREASGISQRELAEYIAPYWNLKAITARAYVHNDLEPKQPALKMVNGVVDRSTRRRRYETRFSDWLAAMEMPYKAREGLERQLQSMNPAFKLATSTVPPCGNSQRAYTTLVAGIDQIRRHDPALLIPIQELITHIGEGIITNNGIADRG